MEGNPGKAIWDVPWMVEHFKDEDTEEESSDSEDEAEDKPTDFKAKMEKKCLKVDRKQSLKPFTELELFTLQLNEMQAEFKKKLRDIESGATDDTSLKSYKPITRWSMNYNEFLPFDEQTPRLPLQQQVMTRSDSKEAKKAEQDLADTGDEVFDWYNDKLDNECYFVITNTNRRTLRKGEEAYCSYGSCTNRYWLETYGFSLEDSLYDAIAVYLQMKADHTFTVDQMVSLVPPAPNDRTTHVQKADLKCNQLCMILVYYLRKVCKEQFYGERAPEVSVLLTKPLDLSYERHIFSTYLAMMEHLKNNWIELDTSLEEDLAMLRTDLDWMLRMVV